MQIERRKVKLPDTAWEDFHERFLEYSKLNPREAIKVLRRVYGEKRRVLILADELTRAKDGDKHHAIY